MNALRLQSRAKAVRLGQTASKGPDCIESLLTLVKVDEMMAGESSEGSSEDPGRQGLSPRDGPFALDNRKRRSTSCLECER